MPDFARLEGLKPSPKEFNKEVFEEYVETLKKCRKRSRLFCVILRTRDFTTLKEYNTDEFGNLDEETYQLEVNQFLIEALDSALNTPEDRLDEEFEYYSQEFHIKGREESQSSLVSVNRFYI